jgi:hypothetical protein
VAEVNEGSKTYILRSILDSVIIERAAETDGHLLEMERKELANSGEDDEDEIRTYGSIISWSAGDQLSLIGVLYVVLALILIHGRHMPDSKSHITNFRNII